MKVPTKNNKCIVIRIEIGEKKLSMPFKRKHALFYFMKNICCSKQNKKSLLKVGPKTSFSFA